MSLQSDLELCLEYAEALEAEQDRLVEAQNNIIFMQNESERLKNKLRICTAFAVLSAVVISVLVLVTIGIRNTDAIITLLVISGALMIVFGVALFNRIKTKKESDEHESRKPSLIQKYTADAENCSHKMERLMKEIYREDLLDIVPENYFSVAAIEFCLTRVRTKMASTAAEALRQLEAEIKRLEQLERLEQMNNAALEQLNDIKRAIEVSRLISIAEEEERKRKYLN